MHSDQDELLGGIAQVPPFASATLSTNDARLSTVKEEPLDTATAPVSSAGETNRSKGQELSYPSFLNDIDDRERWATTECPRAFPLKGTGKGNQCNTRTQEGAFSLKSTA